MSNKNKIPDELAKKNARLARAVFLTVFAMIGLAYASVPLYTLFCQVTGFGGTPQFAEEAPSADKIRERKIRVNFNADTHQNLFWNFKPEQRSVTINIGAQGFASYLAKSEDDQPSMGTAIYNVTPLKAGKYFHKIECFCFGEQSLNPGQEVSMPILFYIDPEFADDPSMQDVDLITLSYTFYRAESDELEGALETYYETD